MSTNTIVAHPLSGARGLKQHELRRRRAAQRRAPFIRCAWIETVSAAAPTTTAPGRAPFIRCAWIETDLSVENLLRNTVAHPLSGARGLKPGSH